MSDSDTYAIIFRGDIALGHTIPDVKRNLQKVFKANDAKIDSLFTGKPVPLKRGLTLSEAQRYQDILLNAGAMSAIESMAPVASKQEDQSSTSQNSSKSAGKTAVPMTQEQSSPSKADKEWQLAPAGTRLSDDRKIIDNKVDIHTEHLAVLPQEGNLLKDDERPAALNAVIDMNALDWELTPYGESLLKASERRPASPSKIEVPNLSLTESGENLLKESEKRKVEAAPIDTSHLRLVPDDNV
ncbi:MAG: hypothetical protein ACRBCI_03010 [Cellvibrionaceae bacterium]